MSHRREWRLPGEGGDRVALVWRPRASERGKRIAPFELRALLATWLCDSATERVLSEIYAWARAAPDLKVTATDSGAPLRRFLEAAIANETLVASRVPFSATHIPVGPHRPVPGHKTEPPGERPVEPTFFEVRFVDEIGEAIASASISFDVDGKKARSTDGDGRARLDDVKAQFGSVEATDRTQLREVLRPRWDQIRVEPQLEPAADHSFHALRAEVAIGASILSETLHTLVVQPWCIRARLIGMYFDTNKSFLLPSAMSGIRRVKDLYDANPASALLIIGHTDTTSDPSYNDPLSLERADAVRDYLTDDVEAWLAWYGADKPWEKRWGSIEDQHMLAALPDAASKPAGESDVRWFQRTRGLTVDGWAGTETRRALVGEYMQLDGTTLPDEVDVTTHGCGESFPLNDDNPALAQTADNQRHRRVELYFFDGRLGVQPPPPGTISEPGSLEYPEWVRRARETYDFLQNRTHVPVIVRLLDPSDQPIGDAPWRAEYGGTIREGRSGSDGTLQLAIPVSALSFRFISGGRSVDLTVSSPENYQEAGDDVGAWERLNNLAYRPGPPISPVTDEFRAAVSAFQDDHDLEINGNVDSATEAEIVSVYGF